jgi:cobalt-zinc-cadmium efflux system outer membrane protein
MNPMKSKSAIFIIASFLTTASIAQDRATASKELASRTGHEIKPVLSKDAPLFPPGISFSGAVTEEDAVAIALWNNASLEVAIASLGLARADVVDAGLLRNFSLQTLLPIGPKPFEFALQAPIEVIWQRPRRMAAAKLDLEKVSKTLIQNGLDLVRDARFAFVDLELAQNKTASARESAELRARIAALTDLRYKAGDISEMDALAARNDASNSEERALSFARDAETAGERLRSLMGLRGDKSTISASSGDAVDIQVPQWDALMKMSMESRPDLRAAELAIQAATQKARWERSRILSLVAPILSVKEVGSSGVRAGPGIAIDAPVFNRNQGSISRADAEVEKNALAYVALRDKIELEVREARLQLLQSQESLRRIRTEILPGIQDAIHLAEKAYSSGDASYLFALESTRQIYDARMREAEAIAAVHRARAQLEHALGRKL